MHKGAGWLQTQAFDDSEQHYRRLAEIAPWAILISRHNRIVQVNPAGLRLLGAATPAELRGRSPFDFIHPDSRQSVRRRIQRLLEAEGLASCIEGKWLRLDGTILDVEITASVYAQADGANAIQMMLKDVTDHKRTEEALRKARDELELEVAERTAALAGANASDLTERKQAEDALHRSLAFNQVILDSLTAQVATLDAGGRITAINESWRQFARENGNPTLEGAGIGANYLHVCQRADRGGDPGAQIVAQGIEAVLNGSLPAFSIEYPCHSPAERRWFELHVNPLIDKAGVVITHENVTQRKLLEERFRQAVEMAPSAMMMVNGRGEIVLANAQAEQVFGYPREELLGQPIEMLVPERLRGHHPGYRAGFLTEPKARPMGKGRELFGLRRDGNEFPVEIGLTPIETEEGVMVLSAIVDISERRRAERQIETALKEKTVLLNEVHHRVKNNLQVIASLLNLQAGRSSSEELRQALRESQHRVHAMALIHQLLYETRNFAAVRLAQYLERLLELQRSSLEAGRIALRLDAAEVHLDVNRAIPCALIVNELVTNAIKHAFPDGRRGEIYIALRKANDEVVLTVSDSGIGLPPAFDWRIATSLGLQIVSLLADQMGAVINVSNVIGARFELCFKGEV